MKKLAAVLVLVLSSFAVAPVLGAPAQAADDPYTAGVQTSCHIAVPAVVRAGASPRIRVHVRPNAPSQAAGTGGAARADSPQGEVTVRITRAGTGIFSRTVAYNGSPVTIEGPAVTQRGHYRVNASFKTADGAVFKSCQGDAAFDVGSGQGPHDDGPDGGSDAGNDTSGGLLPDTGGPNLGWLFLGLVLVGGGGGLTYAAKRRPRAPLYDV